MTERASERRPAMASLAVMAKMGVFGVHLAQQEGGVAAAGEANDAAHVDVRCHNAARGDGDDVGVVVRLGGMIGWIRLRRLLLRRGG